MGSAAAVATGMADIALGTQTAGSIIRPASFCGIYGFRPTFGTVSVAGVKLVAPSLDTVGWFARDAAHLDLVHACLTGRSRALPPTMPALGVARTPCWNSASPDTRQAVYGALRRAREAGAVTGPVRSEQLLDGLERAQQVMTAYEAARSLAWEHGHRDQLSSSLLALLDAGRALDPTDYDEARRRRDRAVAGLDGLFGDAAVLLAPAVVGEAPAGLDGTGDPVFSRAWSLLGLPAAAIPWAQGYTGLPVGVQLIGRPGDDLAVLAAARWFAALLPA
jgi:Asp-tRNA(Asn)/Glu-tRNA(Gln) amidotransferase A subunit family amidase